MVVRGVPEGYKGTYAPKIATHCTTIGCVILTCAQKLRSCMQLNLPQCLSQSTPEARRESMVGERFVKEVAFEPGVKE